jgi:hypothetical protein
MNQIEQLMLSYLIFIILFSACKVIIYGREWTVYWYLMSLFYLL